MHILITIHTSCMSNWSIREFFPN